MTGDIIELKARIGDGPEKKFLGRFAWTLDELVKAGPRGVTPMERPAPRWSHYVYRLRRDGVAIETVTEKHAGNYSGTHARYVLRAPVIVTERVRA